MSKSNVSLYICKDLKKGNTNTNDAFPSHPLPRLDTMVNTQTGKHPKLCIPQSINSTNIHRKEVTQLMQYKISKYLT